MKNGFRQSMAWLHTWAGLVVGWVLFCVFVTGTASYYRADISAWMRPEQKPVATLSTPELARAAEIGVAYLQTHAVGARSWSVSVPHAQRPYIELFWRAKPGASPSRVFLDATTGAPVAVRETRGGDFLYRFHFELHMAPLWGRWIVGICAAIMLVALVSGIVTHRRIFSDFFTLRRDKAPQRGWLDAHNVTGVLALPFHLMITYTGIVTLSLMYMPWGVTTAYNGESQRFFTESGQVTAARPPSGRPGTLAPIGPMVAVATETIPESLERLSIANPMDANATVVAVFEEPHGLSHAHPQVAFNGITGGVVEVRKGALKPAATTFTTMVGLHEAHFAGTALRLLFFVCGLMGSAMVATGLILWSVARLPKAGERPFFGLRLVQTLNIGTILGLPTGIAAYFLANRLLPAGLAERAAWEVQIFFAAWILVVLVSLTRPHRAGWRDLSASTAFLFLAVPVADLLTEGSRVGWSWFDTAMIALALAFAFASRKVATYRPRTRAGALPATALPAKPAPARVTQGVEALRRA